VSNWDEFYKYTVINHTEEDLLTWVFRGECESLVGYTEDYEGDSFVEVVPPRGEVDVFHGTWEPKVNCVQVATADRRLVLSSPYEYGSTYTVNAPLQPIGDPVPQFEDLPNKPLKDYYLDYFADYKGVAAGVAIFLFGVTVGMVVALRLVYGSVRRYAGRHVT
jgi:hypothetical protein